MPIGTRPRLSWKLLAAILLPVWLKSRGIGDSDQVLIDDELKSLERLLKSSGS